MATPAPINSDAPCYKGNLKVLDYRLAIGAVDSAQLRRIISQRNANAWAFCGAYSRSDSSSTAIASY